MCWSPVSQMQAKAIVSPSICPSSNAWSVRSRRSSSTGPIPRTRVTRGSFLDANARVWWVNFGCKSTRPSCLRGLRSVQRAETDGSPEPLPGVRPAHAGLSQTRILFTGVGFRDHRANGFQGRLLRVAVGALSQINACMGFRPSTLTLDTEAAIRSRYNEYLPRGA